MPEALRAPARQIVVNSGAEGDVTVSQILEKSGAYGYDARKGEFVDLVKAGIVDPAKVARIALEIAREEHPELLGLTDDEWLNEIAVIAAAVAHFRRIEERSARASDAATATGGGGSTWRWNGRAGGWRG